MKFRVLTFTFALALSLALIGCGEGDTPESFTITFDSKGGSAVEPITVLDGGQAQEPAAPTKEHYDFLGWYIGENQYTFGDTVVRDIALTAKWAPKEYEITFDADNGESSFTLISVWGEDFTVPIPKREGYNFLGWYQGENEYSFDEISESTTLKARWLQASGDLALTPSDDGKSYTVSGIGGFSGTELIIPSYVEGKPVTAIADNAFYKSSITYVRIPGTVKAVGFMAFGSSAALAEIAIDDGVTKLDSSFYGCTALTRVTLADTIKNMDNAFRGCTSLTSITLPKSLESANNAFGDCTALSMNEADGGLYLGTKDNPYYMLMTLTDKTVSSFNINKGTVIIHTAALMDCKNLTELGIPSSVKFIYGNAFLRCESLTTVIIPSSVTTVASYAFAECTNLTTVYVPRSVEVLGYHTFDRCQKLTVYCAVSKAPDGWDGDWNMSFLDEEIVTVKVVWGSGAIG